MTDYFLDDAANGTNDGLAWATCFNTWAQVNTAAILTAANRLIVGADANITDNGAALTIVGPTSGLPTTIISSTVGSGTTVAYSVGTGKQVDTDSGAYGVIFDGSFAVYGLRVVAGSTIDFIADLNESAFSKDCTFAPGVNYSVRFLGVAGNDGSRHQHSNVTIDLTADLTSPRSGHVITSYYMGLVAINGLTFTGTTGGYRTGTVIVTNSSSHANLEISGANFSNFTNATACEIVGNISGRTILSNCLTAATWAAVLNANSNPNGRFEFYNVGPADAPESLIVNDYFGAVLSSSAIYRQTGATVEGDATSWLIATSANCSEGSPFYTPWIYGTVNSTGAKTFDLYITNDTADFDDSQVWLEVEYLATADSAQWSLATDQRATITTTAAAQDDDTTSTWVGSQANMLQYSEQFNDASWNKDGTTVTENATTDPLSGSTADKLIAGATTARHVVFRAKQTPINDTHTFSCYAKAGEYNYLVLSAIKGANSMGVGYVFDLTTGGSTQLTYVGSFSPSAAAVDVGGGWWRCSVTVTNNDTHILDNWIVGMSPTASPSVDTAYKTSSYLGDASSGIYIWGVQLNAGGSAATYAAVTTASMAAMCKQKLSVPATIGETGQYRARVAVGVASIASSRYFYVDPKVAVQDISLVTDVTSATPANATGASTFSYVDRTAALTAGAVIYQVGAYSSDACASSYVYILQRNSATSYTVVASKQYDHPGGGWYDVILDTPYTVPAGTFYSGCYLPSGGNGLNASTARSYLSGVASGTSNSWSEDTGNCAAIRALKGS